MSRRERGSASIWVLAASALVLTLGLVATVRTSAVLARHRAEAAADLAALAAAGGIGLRSQVCTLAAPIAQANGAQLLSCTAALGPDGRSGTVTVRVQVGVNLLWAGPRQVVASARAGRAEAR